MKTHLILETGCNHQGDFNIAKKMIDEASKLNIWAVKFQKRDIESFSKELKNIPRDLNNSFGINYYEHRKVLEFSCEEIKELMEYANQKNLVFICSAFDERSIYDLIKIECKWIKLPSQLFTNKYFKEILLNIKKSEGTKIIVSTGMHEDEEIFVNSWISHADVVLHCISTYPTTLTKMNLNMLQKLKRNVVKEIGYSSHENEGYGIKYAVMCGAKYIERHFTLNKEWKGSDHGTVSSDPPEIERIISDIKWAERILGEGNRKCALKERKVRKIYRGF